MRILIAGAVSILCSTAWAQAPAGPPQTGAAHADHLAPMGICISISLRKSEVGCWIVTNQKLGKVPSEAFWHLTTFPTRAAADAANGRHGTVVEALGKVWMMTIAEANWEPRSGERVAKIGPLPVDPGTDYTAQYMESIFTPGMSTPVHRHPGPEAWFTLAGETCLETPDGKAVDRPGLEQHVIIPAGRPMQLTATGSETRRSIILVLHDSSKPAGSPAADWRPKGLCTS